MGENNSGRVVALLPNSGVSADLSGAGFITGDFYSMPAIIVAFLLALLVAFIQIKGKIADKVRLA